MTLSKKKKWIIGISSVLALLLIACGIYLFLVPSPADRTQLETQLRQDFVDTAITWLGSNESDGSHKPIIDIYNAHEPQAQSYLVKYDDSWCATFVSAVAIQCGLTDIIPTECGCQRQIGLFQELGRWEENDDYLPSVGDIIYYSFTGADFLHDNTGWSDHVGIVVSVRGKSIKVIEGNHNDKVGYRYILAGDYRIRGYGLPDFASKAE